MNLLKTNMPTINKSYLLSLLSIILSANLSAHSGRTDANGGHTDKSRVCIITTIRVRLKPALLRLKPALLRLKPALLRLKPALLRLKPVLLRLKPVLLRLKPVLRLRICQRRIPRSARNTIFRRSLRKSLMARRVHSSVP